MGKLIFFPSEVHSEKVLEPLPLARIALVDMSTNSSKEPAEQMVVELASPPWNSPDWRLILNANIVAVGHCTSMTVFKVFFITQALVLKLRSLVLGPKACPFT